MASRSSISQAARGSPSRGCPTLPGFSSHSPSLRSSAVPSRRGSPGGGLALVALERERHVRVSDQADAARLGVEAQLGEQRREHVLPDGVARAGVVEPDRALVAPAGSRLSQEGEVLGRDHLARPLGREHRAARELIERDLAGDGEVVVARQADGGVLAGELDAGVRVGAVADEVAEAPQLGRLGRRRRPRASPRAPAGWRGCRR